MKRALALTTSLLILAGCGGETPGGQSGDDGDLSPDKDQPPITPPGLPQQPCEPEELEVELAAQTPFGASPLELVERLGVNDESPLFWVAYDQIPDVTFSPAPGETSLSLGLVARGTATLTTWRPVQENANCSAPNLRVPVTVTVRTSDGALDESTETDLDFTSASTAHLGAQIENGRLQGSFSFETLGDPAQGLVPYSLVLEADLWPGGSRGSLTPQFTQTGPAQPPPPPALANPTLAAAGSPIPTPSVPDHWSSVAVWPRRERCPIGGSSHIYAFAADEPLIGSSMRDIVAELDAQGPWTLSLGDDTANVSFDVEAPDALRCASIYEGELAFEVHATLRTEGDDAPELASLAVTNVYEIVAHTQLDGTLGELRWERRDLYHDESRSAFESATGFALDADDEYEQIWWSWHGLEQRDGDTWTARGGLVVSSLNAEEAAAIANIEAQGGPGVGFSFDETTKFPVMPGDALIDAEIVP